MSTRPTGTARRPGQPTGRRRFGHRWPGRRGDRVTGDTDRGSTAVEAVIIIPVIVVLTLLVVQFVLLWHGRHLAQAAAQTAARAAATYQGTADTGRTDAEAYLAQVAPSLLPGRDVQVTRDAGTVTVTVHADVLTVIPFGGFTVDEHATAPVEAFQVMTP